MVFSSTHFALSNDATPFGGYTKPDTNGDNLFTQSQEF